MLAQHVDRLVGHIPKGVLNQVTAHNQMSIRSLEPKSCIFRFFLLPPNHVTVVTVPTIEFD